METKHIGMSSRFPWRLLLLLLLLPLLVVGGCTWLAGEGDVVATPAPTTTVAGALVNNCAEKESLLILEDSSPSVRDLDAQDNRLLAIDKIIELVKAQPCQPDDEIAIVSFTENQVITGPANAANLGQIQQASGDSTDIAAAVDVVFDLVAARPDARHIVVMISDLDEGSGVPIDQTLDRFKDIELVVVSIGDLRAAGGVTEFQLRSPDQIAQQVANVINESRSS